MTEYLEKGSVSELQELKANFPETLLELRAVRGLGPKKIKTLFSDLGISSLSELEYACEENRLLELKGFGEKTQTALLKSIRAIRLNQGKVILPIALQEAEEVLEGLRRIKGITRVEITGEIRRHSEVVSSLDFLMESEDANLKKAGFHHEEAAFTRTTERGLLVRVFPASKADFEIGRAHV